jgi:hypothetical protein
MKDRKPWFLLLCSLIFSSGLCAQEIEGELVLRSYQHSFPAKTGEVLFQDGDWAIRMGDETFYWAGGRLLPSRAKNELQIWTPHSFEMYPDTAASPEIYSPLYTESLRLQGKAEAHLEKDDQRRDFQGLLYGGLNRREIESRLVRTEFLGKQISVHRDIAEAVKRMDVHLRKTAGSDSRAGNSELALFIAGIGQIGAYNWREIRGTSRMSYHSWGLAIDIQPKQLGNKAIYWRWEQARNENWMLVPLEARWKPPLKVIEAFEQEGFIWGGKWALYDNMHFEYRPELHELKRLIAAARAEGKTVLSGVNPAAPGQDLHHVYPDKFGPKKRWGLFR